MTTTRSFWQPDRFGAVDRAHRPPDATDALAGIGTRVCVCHGLVAGVDVVGDDAVGFEEEFDVEGFGPLDGPVEFFGDGEEALGVGEGVAEGGFGIALGGDDLRDAEEVGEAYGFDDLSGGVGIGGGGIEEVGVGADGGEGDICIAADFLEVAGVGIETGGGGEAEFDTEGGAIVVVGDVSECEAHFGDELELPRECGKWFNKGKAADMHKYLDSLICWNKSSKWKWSCLAVCTVVNSTHAR